MEGYHELSAKTKIYFSTAVAKWDADFYVKVDDDVHVNLGMTLRLRRGYTDCMCWEPCCMLTSACDDENLLAESWA